MAHGARQAKKTMLDSTAPRNAAALFFAPNKTQSPHTGRNSSGEGLESAMAPQSNPNRSQLRVVFLASLPMPRMRNAMTSTQAKSMVVSVISHTQRTAYCMAAGYKAHSHPDHCAILALLCSFRLQRFALSYAAEIVAAEKMVLIERMTQPESAEY